MISRPTNAYAPEIVSSPGETLEEVLAERGITQTELAERTGRPKTNIRETIRGRAPINSAMALQLERVLGIPAAFWSVRERHYRISLARREERQRLQAQIDWLKALPLREMIRRGWVRRFGDEVDQAREVLGFFGVASPEQWHSIWTAPQAVFRRSPTFESAPGAVAAWLRKGELEAQGIACEPFDREGFKGVLQEARGLTSRPPEVFQPRLVRMCARVGVALVFLAEIPGARVSGVARWLAPAKAMIQLSLRYKSDDHLWFTFFHEAGHILLHGKRDVFVEGVFVADRKEEEADRFAANTLVPPPQYRRLLSLKPLGKSRIRAFAEDLGIAPGVLVGRLQHDGHLPFNHCNDLKQRFRLLEAEPTIARCAS